MQEDLIKYWPIVSSFCGMLVGGAITWATAKSRIEQLILDMRKMEAQQESDRRNLEARLAKHEERLHLDEEARNARHIEVISRLSSIEATLVYLKMTNSNQPK